MTLPDKDMVLRACTGTIRTNHPILLAVYALTGLHEARLNSAPTVLPEIDSTRAGLIHSIDCWMAEHAHAAGTTCLHATYLHTESVGMIVDRIGQYSAEAHAALRYSADEPLRHILWQRLSELACAYGDLIAEVDTGRRTLPTLTYLPTVTFPSRRAGATP